jgi:hypothetical protein
MPLSFWLFVLALALAVLFNPAWAQQSTKPADLPIEQPTQYVFVVSPKTAKALGITIAESILLGADEVIR